MGIFTEMWVTFLNLITSPFNNGIMLFALKFIPFVLFLELPLYLFILLGVVRYFLRKTSEIPEQKAFHPRVSCIVTCYSEGKDVQKTIRSLAEQIYPGVIEIMPIIDGASQNSVTFTSAKAMESYVKKFPRRVLQVVPKWQRSGCVSSLNSGLKLATGKIVMVLDGDTSFDNTMVNNAVKHFADHNVVALAGSLRVRNTFKNLITRLQGLEYLLSIHAGKVGLSEFNVVNIISGAFGVFRKSFLLHIGGWDSGTSQDLDITLRIKNYFGRHPELRIVFEPEAVGHTDGPCTWSGFFKQRLRWDSDLYYIYVRKHILSLSSHMVGWRNLIMLLWSGFFLQLVMPFVIVIYSVYSFLLYSTGLVLAVWALVYLLYLIITVTFYVAFITMISERKTEDLRLAWILPVFPLFAFVSRLWNAVATLKEITMKTHLDSSMAPWWVLQRTKF